MFRFARVFLLVEFAAVAGLSHASGYAFKQAGYYVNLAIITMLTPVQLVANLIFGAHAELRPFYFRVLARAGLWNSLGLSLYCSVIVVLAVAWLHGERRRTQ